MKTSHNSRSKGREAGSVIIIVMTFALVFMIIGTALFMLIRSSNSGTALERTDVKAFNVAEAGVDAAMAKLKGSWPRFEPPLPGDFVSVNQDDFRSLYADQVQFPDPSHGEFITAFAYDNTPDNPTSVVENRVSWDRNGDDIMWIDSEADVGNARHRILVLAERLKMPVAIPDVALVANRAGGNGLGLAVDVDPDYHGSLPVGADGVASARAVYHEEFDKGVNPGAGILRSPQASNPFESFVPQSLTDLLKLMAQTASPISFFDDTNPDGAAFAANEFLTDPATGPGSIVYVESSIDLGGLGKKGLKGNDKIGTPEQPVILVIDATKNPSLVIDWVGTANFYGAVIVLGDALIRGDLKISGCILSKGSVENKGGPGILYNGDYIRRVNEQHTLSVALVPNTWEEYTIAK